MSKKKIIIIAVPLVLLLFVGYSVAAPKKKAPKLKVQGTIYVMPQAFLLNLSEGHYAKLSIGLELAPGQKTEAAAASSSSSSSSEAPGDLPEEPLVREIVTNAITGQSGSTLVSAGGRNTIKHEILDAIKRQTDLKVEAIVLPEVTVQ